VKREPGANAFARLLHAVGADALARFLPLRLWHSILYRSQAIGETIGGKKSELEIL
jgi:hypothetical protein